MAAAGAHLAGCGNVFPAAGEVPIGTQAVVTPSPVSPQGGTLVVGMAASSIVTLDPAAYSDRATETVVRNIFDGLVTRTDENEVVLELAAGYRWLDSETVEFDLKRGVRFHNGEELTADDVVFTFERILYKDVGAERRGFIQEVESVEEAEPRAGESQCCRSLRGRALIRTFWSVAPSTVRRGTPRSVARSPLLRIPTRERPNAWPDPAS